jgi:murein DD-endopeptidase MepM/ murein hydrolase activator NlpD
MAHLPPVRTFLPARLAGLAVALAVVLVLAPVRAGAATTDPVGVWPLDPVPEVVATFEPPSSTWGSGHRGVDLLGSVAEPVLSALPGRVSFAGRIAGRGVVVVDHGDTRTTYEPVTATLEVGDPVASGHRIGVLELAGSHCFPRACLHWGWLRGETYLDPLLLVGAGPVRLLPLWRDEPVGLTPLWVPPVSPYAGWRPPVQPQALGCACW